MKKITTTLITLLFAGALFAQTETNTSDSKAEISFAKTEHNCGTITQGDNGSCEFEFTNTGTEALTLTQVKASCGCTVPEWSKEPVLPGAKGKIVVKYNTNNIGVFHKIINVYSNAKTNHIVLTISGDVKPKTSK